MVIRDDGKGKFSCTTLENTAGTEKRSAQVERLETIESLPGGKWTMETVSSEVDIKDAKERLAEGDVFAVYKLIETEFVTGVYGGGGWSVG
ncbi:hypothetical protein V2W45_1338736 [Cenococcum geophilum]